MVYTPLPAPPRPFMFVCYLLHAIINLACINLAWLHLFGEASKMNRLLFTLTVVVLMAAHGEYCTTLEFER